MTVILSKVLSRLVFVTILGLIVTSVNFVVIPSSQAQIRPLVDTNSEQFFRRGREQFDRDIKRLMEGKDLLNGNILQVDDQLPPKIDENLENREIRSLEEFRYLPASENENK